MKRINSEKRTKVKIGDTIKILQLDDPYDQTYPGRIGKVTKIDFLGQIHGTWGSFPIIPQLDKFEIL